MTPQIPADVVSLNQLLRLRAQENHGRWLFLTNRGRTETFLNYAQLYQRAQTVAAKLTAQGCKPGDRVLLLFQTGPAFLEGFFGCLLMGVVAVPLNPPRPNRTKARYLTAMEDCQASLILTDLKTEQVLSASGQHQLPTIVTETLPTLNEPFQPDFKAEAHHLAFLQYTSGSTGHPKGVMVSHGNLLANLEAIRLSGVCTDDVFVNWLPFFHDMGLIHSLLQPLYASCLSVHLSPAAFMQRPMLWLEAISKYRGTVCGGPNFAFEQCLRRITPEALGQFDLSCWRLAFTGAEPIRAETMMRFAETFAQTGFSYSAFYPCYGLAEATLMVTGGAMAAEPQVIHLDRDALAEHRVHITDAGDHSVPMVDCGVAVNDTRIATVNPETGAMAAQGEIGEIWVSGRSVAQGYWQKEEATQKTFANTLPGSFETWLATGDLGFLNGDRLFITGRLKDLIIMRGRNHIPTDLETTASAVHPDLKVDGCAAFTVEDQGQTRLVIAQEIVRGRTRQVDPQTLGQAVRGAIAQQHDLQLDTLVLLKPGSLPKTTSGKIQRQGCKQQFLEGTLPVLHRWPDAQEISEPTPSTLEDITQLQAWLTTKVGERLGVTAHQIDPHQPLALYGMDSPTALGLLGDLETHLQRELSPTLIYEYPTIAQLCRFLCGDTEQATPSDDLPPQEPVAVIGMACRFPGARNTEAFWELLRDGRDAVTEVPADRWPVDDYYCEEPGIPDKTVTRWGGFLDDVDQFAADLFQISQPEAENMDPQQRLLLEVAWEAMDHSGRGTESFRGSQTGVFMGVPASDYSFLQLTREGGRNAMAGTGCAGSITANRLSWQYDLRGPSISQDTACSSSLVVLDRACKSLALGESEAALAGAVNLMLTPHLTIALSQAGMMSPDGRCRAFDARANGYVRAEGCAVVVLKTLSCALKEGSPILGVIRGSAVNQDGRGNGLTAPNGRAQKEVLRQALSRAKVQPHQVNLLEAHGTGTALGDPIEVEAIRAVYGTDRQNSPCWLGSVKTNIGHTETVAGFAGLIKVLLALREETIPQHLHFQTPNTHVHLDETLRLTTQAQPWPRTDKPRLAGISSFGIGGTNAHVIVSEPPKRSVSTAESRNHVFVVSAESEDSLKLALKTLQTHLTRHPDTRLDAVAQTLQLGRTHLRHRAAWVANNTEDLLAQVDVLSGQAAPQSPRIAFLFPGQGSQFNGMGAACMAHEPTYAQAVNRCLKLLQEQHQLDLKPFLCDNAATSEDLKQTRFTQPALFVLGYGLAQFWASRGVQPQAMLGHSIGEWVAACLAGVFTLEEALALVVQRGALMQDMPAGAMLTVAMDEAALVEMLPASLDLAAINGPKRCVVAGASAEIENFAKTLTQQGVQNKRLVTSHAFHSRMMDAAANAFAVEVAKVQPQAPQLPFVSNVSGTWITPEQATDPQYWADQIRQPVRFAQGFETLTSKADVYLELGPGQTLCSLGRSLLAPQQRKSIIPCLGGPRTAQDDHRRLLQALAHLYVSGATLTWPEYAQKERTHLPPLVMTKHRYWIDTTHQQVAPTIRAKDPSDWFYMPGWEQSPPLPASRWKPGTTLVFHDRSRTADEMVQALEHRGDQVICVHLGTTFQNHDSNNLSLNANGAEDYQKLAEHLQQTGAHINRVIHFWLFPEITHCTSQAETALSHGFLSLMYLLQNWEMADDPQLLVVTRQVHEVESGDVARAEKATILGTTSVIGREYAQLNCTHLDLDFNATPAQIVTQLLHTLATKNSARTIAVRGNRHWVRRFVPVPVPQPEEHHLLRARGTYLITGGLGGIGRSLGMYLAQHYQARLILLGRQALPPKDQWANWRAQDPEKEARIAAIEQMEELGSEVITLGADITQTQDISKAVKAAEARFGRVDGVIHAAGIAGDGQMRFKTEAEVRTVLAPKLAGTLALEAAFFNKEPDFIAYCSSVFALDGEFGQSDYCAANSFLDAFAIAHDHPRSRRISISWGAWREAGMAARMNVPPALQQAHQQQLCLGLNQQEGGEAFARALHAGLPHISVSPQPLEKLFAAHEAFAKAMQAPKPETGSAKERTLQSECHPPANEQETLIAQIWSELTGVQPIGRHDSFFELGGDSLIATHMFNLVKQRMGKAPAIASFYEQPTVAGIAALLGESEDAQVRPTLAQAPDQANIPLSYAQHRIWYDTQLHPGTTRYNLPARVVVEGELDTQRFTAAFATIIERHEIMRTRFLSFDGTPQQCVAAPFTPPLAQTDLSEVESGQQEASLKAIEMEEANHVFDLENLPLFRLHLVRLNTNHHVLFLNMHHIIFDGFSEVVLVEEWLRTYHGENLPALPLQYKDYAYWQRNQETPETLVSWWQQHMSGAPRLRLPQDRSGERSTHETTILWQDQRAQNLKSLAKQTQTTPYVLAMGAYMLTLYRFSGQRDLVLGVDFDNRRQPGLEQLIGFFVNPLPIRFQVDTDESLVASLKRLRRLLAEAEERQDMPFHQLVDLFRGDQEQHLPLIQSIFVQQNQDFSLAHQEDLTWKLERDIPPCKFETAVFVAENQDSLRISMNCAPDLFLPTTFAAIQQGFEQTLAAMVDHPEQKVANLEPLKKPQPTKKAVPGKFKRRSLSLPGTQ